MRLSPRFAPTRAGWLLGAVLFGLAAVSVARAAMQEPFPHQDHARLFPLCSSCHNLESGSRADLYPAQGLCARCHDGEIEQRVTWSPPAPQVNNLRFDHNEHAREAAADSLTCETCHAADPGQRMSVRRVDAPQCLTCHAHRAQEHYVDARCSRCHVPLVESGFATARIAALPEPSNHDRPTFIHELHGAAAEASLASCQVCHTRELCTTCHVNAQDVAEIGRMPSAPAALALPPFEAHYEAPSSHAAPDFLSAHGESASPGSCGACHTRDDCTTCHVQPAPEEISALRTRAETQAPGATLAREMPSSHQAPGFSTRHGAEATTNAATCAMCHSRTTCTDCHDAARSAVFHPANFLARHSSEAYGRRLECSNCHETQTFCRNCHVQTGTQAVGRLGPGFHDAEPLWLLRHGTPARRALESCTSCHQQRDCLQCHSTLGSFRINPHGPDFDAAAAEKRNPIICKACHIGRVGTE